LDKFSKNDKSLQFCTVFSCNYCIFIAQPTIVTI